MTAYDVYDHGLTRLGSDANTSRHHIGKLLVDAIGACDSGNAHKALILGIKAAARLSTYIEWQSDKQRSMWLTARPKPSSLKEVIGVLMTALGMSIVLDSSSGPHEWEEHAIKDALASFRWWVVANETQAVIHDAMNEALGSGVPWPWVTAVGKV